MPSQPRRNTPPKKRLDRQAFVALALKVICESGKGRLGVHEVVRLMGVTTGSFYWHFKNREEFVQALLEYWAEGFTYQVKNVISKTDNDPRKQLLKLATLIIEEDLGSYDVAMRTWALREKRVAQYIEKVDRFRFDFVRNLFSSLGFRGNQLDMRTKVYTSYFSMESAIRLPFTKAKRKAWIKPLVKLLTERDTDQTKCH